MAKFSETTSCKMFQLTLTRTGRNGFIFFRLIYVYDLFPNVPACF